MDILWKRSDSELTARDVATVLPKYAYTTIATILDRLVHKGLVHRRKVGRTIRFGSIGTPSAHSAVLMHEALVDGQDPDGALVRFASTLSQQEATVLRRALNKSERARRRPAR
jgi:predicted transcriptional regulator